MNPIILSISLLASNRPDTIRKCLDSLKPLMKQIPSELILVDTSKNPQVHEILLEYTDQVVEFEWCNDFSKARNTGLKLAKGKWFLFLDDDEWFVEIDPLIHFFQSGEYKQYGCANYIVRNFMDKNYINYSDSWVSRMVKLGKDTCFKSKVHEYLHPVTGKCKHIPALAYHSGYIYSTEEERLKHFERNATLLRDMIQQEPDKLRWQVQLAQELRSAQKWEELRELCINSIEQTKDRNSKYENYDIGTFYAGATEAFHFLGRYQEGIEMANRALTDKRMSPMCHGFIQLSLSSTYFKMENWDSAEDHAYKYLKLCREMKKDAVMVEEQKTALLVGETLDAIRIKRAYTILMACGLKRKDTSALKKHAGKLEWDSQVIYVYDGFTEALIEAMSTMPYESIFGEVMQLAWNNAELQNKLYIKILELGTKNKEEHERILRVLSHVEGKHWYLWYAKVIADDMDYKKDTIFESIRGYYEHSINIFMTPEEIVKIVKKYEFPLEECLLALPFETWTTQLEDTLTKINRAQVSALEQEFSELKKQENIRYEYFFMRILEGYLLYEKEKEAYEIKEKNIRKFLEKTCNYFRKYYTKEVIKDYSELLPEYAQAAFYMEKAFFYEKTELEKYKENLELAAKTYKKIAEQIQSFMLQ